MQVDSKQIAKNSVWLYVRMLIVTLVSLYTSRIILKALGVEDFGIYNVAGGVIAFVSMLTTGMASSTQRFLNVCKGEGDLDGLSKIMNTSITLHVLFGFVLFLIGDTVGLYVVARLLVFPESRYVAAIVVYQAALFTLLFAVFKIPYSSLVITYERFSFVAILSLLEVSLKLLIAFILLHVKADALILYGFSFTVLEILLYCIYRHYCRSYYQKQKISKKAIMHSKESKSLVKFSMWSMLGSVGSTFANQGITVMLNFFFSLAVNAAMGITNQVTNVLASFINNVQQAFRPQLIQSYANRDGSFERLICTAAKWSFIMMMFVCIPLACNLNGILHIWLETVPIYTYHFILILLVFLIIDTLSTPLSYAIDATGKIARYQMRLFSLMLLNVVFAWGVCKIGLNPPFVIATKVLINCAIFTLRLLTLKRNSTEFTLSFFFSNCIRQLIPIIIYALTILTVSHYLTSWYRVICSTVFYIFGLCPLVYFYSMSGSEKLLVSQIIHKALNK